MARKQASTLFPPAQRAEIEEFVARQIAPKSMRRIAGILSKYSDADLMNTMTAANLHAQSKGDALAVGGYVSGDDISSIRLLAENASNIRMGEVQISAFYEIVRALERLGIMEKEVDSFPALASHLEVHGFAYFGHGSYYRNDALMIFVQENLHQHREVVDYMTEHATSDVAVLRSHFNGEAPVLAEGML